MSSLYARFKSNGPSGFGYGSTASDVTEGLDLTGKNILLTGCNSGIGLESMRVLASRGAHILGAARTEDKAAAAARGVGASITPLSCELSEPDSVLACVDKVRSMDLKLDVLLLNAGIMALPRLEKAHGYELQFFTNHVGHFLLGTGLLDRLADNARVVVLSSRAHENAPRGAIDFNNLDGSRGYSSWKFYGQSKIANVLFARELARRFGTSGKVANAVHPGVIATSLHRHIGPAANAFYALANPIALKTIPQGAATQCWAAVHPDAGRINGEYLFDCNVHRSSRDGQNMEVAARLWTETEKIVASWRS